MLRLVAGLLLGFGSLVLAGVVLSQTVEDLGAFEGSRAGGAFLSSELRLSAIAQGLALGFGQSATGIGLATTIIDRGLAAGLDPASFGHIAGAQTKLPSTSNFGFAPEIYLGLSFLLFIFSAVLYSINISVMPSPLPRDKGQLSPANEPTAQQS